MIETIFDTLNAKAAIFAVETELEALGVSLPIMISVRSQMLLAGHYQGKQQKHFITHCAMRSRYHLA